MPSMNMKRLTFLLTLIFALTSQSLLIAADADKTKPVKHVNAVGAAKVLKDDSKVVVLDIRTPKEFKAGHIKGAKNLDFYEDDFEARLKKLETDKTYLVHCASGGRSTKALELFKKLGFKSVIHLDGGFKDWEKSGQPVEK
jgi:phage shock protein E